MSDFASIPIGKAHAVVVPADFEVGDDGKARPTGQFAAFCPEHGPIGVPDDRARAGLLAYDHNASEHDGAEVDELSPATLIKSMRVIRGVHRHRLHRLIVLTVIEFVFFVVFYAWLVDWRAVGWVIGTCALMGLTFSVTCQWHRLGHMNADLDAVEARFAVDDEAPGA